MLKINGTTITSPSKFQVDISDIDGETTRNAQGELIRDRIAVKRKLSLEFPALSQSEISTILSKVTDIYFSVEYPDPISGITTKTFYVGDRSSPMYRNINGNILWEGLKFNLIEK